MNAERHSALCAAYGSDPERWPEDERAGARAWRAANPDAAVRTAAADARLDDLLGAWRVPGPDGGLAGRIGLAVTRQRDIRRRLALWASGLAAAATLAAGAAAGAAMVSIPADGLADSGGGGLYELQVLGLPLQP